MSWQNTGNSENIYHIVCRIVQQLMHVIPFLKRVKIFESYCSFKFGLISALFYHFSMFPLIPFFGFGNRNWRFYVDLVLTVEDLVTIKVWMMIWKLLLMQLSTPFFISNAFISKARLILVKIKQKLSKTLRLNSSYLKIIHFLHPRYHPKIKRDILGNVQKTSASVLMRLYDQWQWKQDWKTKADHTNTT